MPRVTRVKAFLLRKTNATLPPESEELKEPECIDFDETDEEDVYVGEDEEDGSGKAYGDRLADSEVCHVILEFLLNGCVHFRL
ncbi:hypothetical protein F0562_017512 [Nyssa sinensis]|uniref:Uncharacterized protein n=1 Tax=Nyssa sinensis TaxID=561372 RepID=A0A5J4ZIZ8_9ASTE|nr:hypothetical protein F0562_017512 [Nyssa sinensis]